MPRPGGRRLLSVTEVAAALNVSERTVYRLVKERKLSRPRRVGGESRWFPGDVRVYLYRLRRGDFEDDGQENDSAKPPQNPARPRQGGAKD